MGHRRKGTAEEYYIETENSAFNYPSRCAAWSLDGRKLESLADEVQKKSKWRVPGTMTCVAVGGDRGAWAMTDCSLLQ